MTSAYEWIITTRSFHRTRNELLSAAWEILISRLYSLPNDISEFFSRYSESYENWTEKKLNNSDFNIIPAIAEIIIVNPCKMHTNEPLNVYGTRVVVQWAKQWVWPLSGHPSVCLCPASSRPEIPPQWTWGRSLPGWENGPRVGTKRRQNWCPALGPVCRKCRCSGTHLLTPPSPEKPLYKNFSLQRHTYSEMKR